MKNELKMKSGVKIYTDGACKGNPGPGGYGAILQYGEASKELSGGFALTTNNRMEIFAAIVALEALKEPCGVQLYSDSSYLVNAVQKSWLDWWKSNNWVKKDKKPVQNVDLWQRLDTMLQIHQVTFHWVKGHASNVDNNRCDVLASQAAEKSDLPEDVGYGIQTN